MPATEPSNPFESAGPSEPGDVTLVFTGRVTPKQLLRDWLHLVGFPEAIRWNEGTSYPIQSGHPCLGCTEAKFWDNGPFYQRLGNIPGYGIEANADKIGTGVGAAVVAGLGAHAVLTNFRKRHEIGEQPGENAEQAERGDAPSAGPDPKI